MSISVVGVDFRTAALDLRERLALDRAQTLELLHTIAAEQIFPEAMVLSTCNRTEIYFTPDRRGGRHDVAHALEHLAEIKGVEPVSDQSVFYRHEGMEAVRHLLRVAAALESQIVGEHEILGQVKDAYRLACEARTAKFLFHKLLHWSFRAAKRVRTETRLGEGTASVAQAAVELARETLGDLAGRTVLLVGAGQTGRKAAAALVRAGADRLIVANRTPEAAAKLADRLRRREDAEPPESFACPALAGILAACSLAPPAGPPEMQVQAVSLEDIPAVIGGADLVISSTGSGEPVLTCEKLAGPLRQSGRPLAIIDIAVPRDAEPALGELSNVHLSNIDSLEAMVQANLARRRAEIPAAEAIVEQEVARFGDWLGSLDVVPTIKLLTEHMQNLAAAEARRYRGKFTDADSEQLEDFARALCKKVLHDPITFLGQLGDGEDDLAAVSVLRRIFDLQAPSEGP